MRLIDVDKIELDYSGLADIYPYDFIGTAKYFADQIKSAPTVDAEPVVHAHWIEEMWGDGWNEYTDLTCSACRKKFKKFSKTKRCPSCGAKMDL